MQEDVEEEFSDRLHPEEGETRRPSQFTPGVGNEIRRPGTFIGMQKRVEKQSKREKSQEQ